MEDTKREDGAGLSGSGVERGVGRPVPERASTCGLTECRGQSMCVRCQRIADMDALCSLLPKGVHWGDPLTPELLRAVLASPRQVECRRLYADW